MILYTGPYADALLVADDVCRECPDLYVGFLPHEARAIEPDRCGEWAVVIGCQEELPMLHMFSFTDEQHRTFEWGLEERAGETYIICKAGQSVSSETVVDGENRKLGEIVYGLGDGTTAQIAYDKATTALAEQVAQARKRLDGAA